MRVTSVENLPLIAIVSLPQDAPLVMEEEHIV